LVSRQLRSVSFPGARAPAPSRLGTAAKLKVGGIKGSSVPAFAPPGMRALDQLLGQLSGRNPDVGDKAGILSGKLGFETRFADTHCVALIRYGTTSPVDSDGVKVSAYSRETLAVFPVTLASPE
jgi:hypothetical protein